MRSNAGVAVPRRSRDTRKSTSMPPARGVSRFVNTSKRPDTTARNRQRSPLIRHGIERDSVPREVLAAHRRLAAEFGNQPDAVVRAARERAQQLELKDQFRATRPRGCHVRRDKNFEREAVVDERLLVRDSLRRGMGEVRYAEVRDSLAGRLRAGEFVSVQRSRASDRAPPHNRQDHRC